MKVLLVAIDTKFIHTNLALRYLKANCHEPTVLQEYTLKDSIESISAAILKEMPDVVAFSVYLWNISIIEKLTKILRKAGSITIIAGGPEVSYDADYFLNKGLFDYIIAGEGELSFDRLITALKNHTDLDGIPNLVTIKDGKVVHHKVEVVTDLDALKNPYHFPEDLVNLPHKIQYIELSRGCPFHCAYCLASLENRVRFFSLDRVKNDLLYLMQNGAKTFKFLDRTFNLNLHMAKDIFQFIIDHHFPETVFQFEITGDILPRELILFLNTNAPKNLFRFEIGVQSTNVEANKAVDRKQDNEVLFENIRLIRSADIIDLHLDLIAGLPNEDLPSFVKTFDEVFALRAKELQLGFLKMLRGTKLRRESDLYGYRYQENPPYEITENHALSKSDLEEIHLAEETLEIYWNKGYLSRTMDHLIQKVPSAFWFFNQLGHFYQAQGYSFHRYQYSDLYEHLALFVKINNPDFYPEILDSLKYEYLESCHVKSKIWWDNSTVQAEKNKILREYFAENKGIPIDDLYKYSIVTSYETGYLIAFYHPKKKSVFLYKEHQ